MFNKKLVTILSAMLILVMALTGCAGGNSDTGATSTDSGAATEVKDTIIIAQGADAKSLDPHATNDQPSSRVSKQVYSRLVEMNEEMEIVPGAAESWTFVDDTTVEFKLREGAMFHNGEELKASDVKFTLDRMIESKKVAHIIAAVTEIVVIDDYTVQVKTDEPFGPLLSHLSHTAASILNEKAVTEGGDDYGQNPVGTGPYKFVSWTAGDKITLEAYPEYFGGEATIKNVVFRNITEGTNRTIGLETGEIDVAYDIEPIDKQRVADDAKLQLVESPSLSYAYIGINTTKGPLADAKVRKAINYAIDVPTIIDVVLEGAGELANAPIGPRVFGHNADVDAYGYDVEMAKSLLAEAGLADGFTTTIWTNDNPVRMQIAQIVQAQLLEVGINVTIEPLEWGSYLERTAKGEHDMFILGWTTVTADADYGLYALYHSSQKGGAGNRDFYENPEVDTLLEAGRKATNPEERKDAYAKAQEIIVSEAPDVMLYYGTQNIGAQANVKGFKLHPAGHHSVYGVSFE